MEIKVRTTEPNDPIDPCRDPRQPPRHPCQQRPPPSCASKVRIAMESTQNTPHNPPRSQKMEKQKGGGSRQREEGSQPGRDGEDEETDLQNRRGRRGIACAKLQQKNSPLPGKTRRGEPKMKNENRSNRNVAGKKWHGYE